METALANCFLKETVAPCNALIPSHTPDASSDAVRIMTSPAPPNLEVLEAQEAPAIKSTLSNAAIGLQRIKDEIMFLKDNGLYAIPVTVAWDTATCQKRTRFPHKWGTIKDKASWEKSIGAALKQRSDANGLAILTEASRIFAIDVDVTCTKGKRPGVELWSRLIELHGEPVTLKAESGQKGYHYLFKADSPGLTCTKSFSNLKVRERSIGNDGCPRVDVISYGIDARACGGLLYAEPTCYKKGDEELAIYRWLNGPPSYDGCKEIPLWLADIVNNGGITDLEPVISSGTCSLGENEQSSEDTETGESNVASNHAVFDTNESIEATEVANGESGTSNLPGLQPALIVIREMLQNALPSDQSRFNGVGMRTQTGWQVLKFKTVGTRTCLNGCEHVSNNFSILSNGGILLYRCLSSECIKRPKCLLGVYYWPECLPLRADASMIRECERYLVPRSNETKKLSKEEAAERKKRKNDMYDLLIKVMNAYFAVVIGGNKTVYTEIVFCRDRDGNPQREEVIERPGHNFIERCRNIQLDCLHGKNKEVAKFWESNSKRREYDRIVFDPDLSRVTSRHFNLFCGLEFEPILQKLEPSEMADCELQMPKLMWHIRAILSDGCKTRFAYNIKWMAHAVQRPGKKIGVALVLRGPQGCGKSTLADFFGMKIIGGKNYLYCN
jgi:hypothetical protein